ncbi:hypothetical protein [Thalassospira marina]|uniref:Uncharacterized protein n=1 Tax=Thalassospira marina TaxID=2048283 RepID=A0A2N3KY89_9PROT|nr:hypothetical protein [Thalassospira marina]PKR55436.1 hypothetical protein COO20_04500 [Thalassospira marina]
MTLTHETQRAMELSSTLLNSTDAGERLEACNAIAQFSGEISSNKVRMFLASSYQAYVHRVAREHYEQGVA